jgi:hypothetical protein
MLRLECHSLATASPERRLVFDVSDFDGTLPGPWEWDVKRLAVKDRRSLRTSS